MGKCWRQLCKESAEAICFHAMNNEWFCVTGCTVQDRHAVVSFILGLYTKRDAKQKDTWLFDHSEDRILKSMRTIAKAGCVYDRYEKENSVVRFMKCPDYTLVHEGVRFDTQQDICDWQEQGRNFLEMKRLAGYFQELYGLGRVLLAMEQGEEQRMPMELARHFTVLRLIDN